MHLCCCSYAHFKEGKSLLPLAEGLPTLQPGNPNRTKFPFVAKKVTELRQCLLITRVTSERRNPFEISWRHHKNILLGLSGKTCLGKTADPKSGLQNGVRARPEEAFYIVCDSSKGYLSFNVTAIL